MLTRRAWLGLLVCQWTSGKTVLRYWLPRCCERPRITDRCVRPLLWRRKPA